ncbi:MAG: hypothetical protein FWD68_07870 [Alphaproteobacteria bacterium]|nr:hypothetical protein [Alphaproteobacteria bacterium]
MNRISKRIFCSSDLQSSGTSRQRTHPVAGLSTARHMLFNHPSRLKSCPRASLEYPDRGQLNLMLSERLMNAAEPDRTPRCLEASLLPRLRSRSFTFRESGLLPVGRQTGSYAQNWSRCPAPFKVLLIFKRRLVKARTHSVSGDTLRSGDSMSLYRPGYRIEGLATPESGHGL